MPSDVRPKGLFSSITVHPVINAVELFEQVIRSRENEDYDEDEETAARATYNLELRRLEDKFPEHMPCVRLPWLTPPSTPPHATLPLWSWVPRTVAVGGPDGCARLVL